MVCRFCKNDVYYYPIKLKHSTLIYEVCSRCNWAKLVSEEKQDKELEWKNLTE
jgi:hypothetical protein